MLTDEIKNKGPAFVKWWQLYVVLIERYYNRSQENLANDAGVSGGFISELKDGKKGCKFPVQKRISLSIYAAHPKDPEAVMLVDCLLAADPPTQKAVPVSADSSVVRSDDFKEAVEKLASVAESLKKMVENPSEKNEKPLKQVRPKSRTIT